VSFQQSAVGLAPLPDSGMKWATRSRQWKPYRGGEQFGSSWGVLETPYPFRGAPRGSFVLWPRSSDPGAELQDRAPVSCPETLGLKIRPGMSPFGDVPRFPHRGDWWSFLFGRSGNAELDV